ncbi:MAG TPA: P-loop NTPase [Fibrobacteraceae bacterium]|nr:P-loop NTPase [Fibrobacteraceae bacterium]
MSPSLPTSDQVLETLQAIEDPDFHRNIVELGFVQNLTISEAGVIHFDLVLTTPACPVKDQFVSQCRSLLGKLPGVTAVQVDLKAKEIPVSPLGNGSLLKDVRHIIAVASGKGGVGKSTVTANLAMSLALAGARVGVLDADIYGPSMVMMFGVQDNPEVREDNTLVPVSVAGIQIVSMAMFSDPNKATIWRGPMATQMIQNFLHRVHWGRLDYLLIDFPPGTGDIQLTLTQNCPISGAVVVTTPQNVALADVRKGLAMFRAVAVPVLGVVENMSYFICDQCGKHHYIFRQGGGKRTAEELKLDFLGGVPLEPGVADSGDAGRPVVYSAPNSASARAFMDIAGQVVSQLEVRAVSAGGLGSFSQAFEELPVMPVPPNSVSQPSAAAVAQSVGRTPNGQFALGWSDGVWQLFTPHHLRLHCPCASCVDEWTGEPLLDPASISADVQVLNVYTVGRYALGISFTDGHRSGIYTYDQLKQIGHS